MGKQKKNLNPQQRKNDAKVVNKMSKVIRKVTNHEKANGLQSNQKLTKQIVALPNLGALKKEQIKQLENKANLDPLQREKLIGLKLKSVLGKPKRDMSSFLMDIQAKATKFEGENPDGVNKADDKDIDPNERQMAQSRKAYYRELKKVIEESDVIMEVLDARDPQGCRNHEIE